MLTLRFDHPELTWQSTQAKLKISCVEAGWVQGFRYTFCCTSNGKRCSRNVRQQPYCPGKCCPMGGAPWGCTVVAPWHLDPANSFLWAADMSGYFNSTSDMRKAPGLCRQHPKGYVVENTEYEPGQGVHSYGGRLSQVRVKQELPLGSVQGSYWNSLRSRISPVDGLVHPINSNGCRIIDIVDHFNMSTNLVINWGTETE